MKTNHDAKTGKSHAITVAMLAILIGIGVVGHYASPLLVSKTDVNARPEAGCRIEIRDCLAILPDGGKIELSITPRPVPMVSPLRVQVRTSGLAPTKIEVDFAGETMNMGFNRIALTPTGHNLQSGETSLPVCISGPMNWIVTVLVETDRQRVAVPFLLAMDR